MMRVPEDVQDLTIIGGGVMGLFTAYYAAQFSAKVVILEQSVIGDKKAASFSYTRSIRNDYLDPLYARLAYEARTLWLDLQRHASEPLLIECGCLNIATEKVTPDLAATYAAQSYDTLTDLNLHREAFSGAELAQRFPQFTADLGRLDVEAGLLYVPAVTQALLNALRTRDVTIVEQVDVATIEEHNGIVSIGTNKGAYQTRKLVVTAGLKTNDVLRQLPGNTVQFPLTPDRPSQCKYFIPPPEKWEQFTSDVLPVFAYLDVGIYGHPIYAGKTTGVKIGYYNPPDVKTLNTRISDVHSFVEQCMPALRDARAV
ncbi:MAG TPA: FAD-dependent oxidoreductase, partial [Ktedonobacteraceae bacterium]|nr:FAD-dependent oxidoreductase [Ktedonobacteraceae bacterium]